MIASLVSLNGAHVFAYLYVSASNDMELITDANELVMVITEIMSMLFKFNHCKVLK